MIINSYFDNSSIVNGIWQYIDKHEDNLLFSIVTYRDIEFCKFLLLLWLTAPPSSRIADKGWF